MSIVGIPDSLGSRALSLACAMSMLAGCTITESTNVRPGTGDGCDSVLGSYFLPRAFLRVKIDRANATSPNILTEITPFRRVDNDHLYCLDHVSSVFADDQIVVQKDRDVVPGSSPEKKTTNQFLGLVTSKAVDQSAIIIRKVIRTIFVGIAQTGNILRSRFRVDSTIAGADSVSLEFDPFDQVGSGRANDAMRRLGFCLILEDFTFNTVHADVEAYCNAPRRFAAEPTVFALNFEQEVVQAPRITTPGIYYRPRAPYRLAIYTNDQPDISRKWNLSKTQVVMLENISPLVRLRIDRSVFAARRLALVFEDGTLQGACLFKGSEILGGIEIPLEVVRGIVKLPTVMFQVKIDEFTRSKDLIEAEQQLILTQKAYIDFLNKKEGATALTGGKTGDATNTVDSKLNPVGPPTTSERLPDPPTFTTDSGTWPSDVGTLCNRGI